MKAFDLQRMALDKFPLEFLGEVALRSLYTFILVFLFLKITGRRGVRQMSLFEVLIILTLGSAAGDVAFYDDVPLLPVLVVFVTLGVLYRLVMWLMSCSEKLEDLLEGKPRIIIEDGELAWEKLNRENMTNSSFLWSCVPKAWSIWGRCDSLFLRLMAKSAFTTIPTNWYDRACRFCRSIVASALNISLKPVITPVSGVAKW